ncbi:MAG: DUF692 domain-containing protein [Myxococcota bacterium]
MGLPHLGHGVGLRRPHFDAIFERRDEVDFLEILVDNAMAFGGRPRDVVERAAREFPIVLHGVALSVGGPDPLDEDYLAAYVRLARETRALWVSDHLSYSSAFGVQYHDLIPLPFTEEAVEHVVARTRQAQAAFDVPFALENPSYYVSFPDSEMTEAEFVREVVERADCGLLLDVNNVWVNAQNHGYDPRAFIDAMPAERVVQIHMAGHLDRGDVLIDTHGAAPIDEVLDLYAYTLERTGPVSTLLEWDHDVPSLDVLLAENERIRRTARRTHGEVVAWRA